MLKNKMQIQAQKKELCPKFNKFENLCPIELMLTSQIIPFMFFVAKTKGAQHGVKWCFSTNRLDESLDHFRKH